MRNSDVQVSKTRLKPSSNLRKVVLEFLPLVLPALFLIPNVAGFLYPSTGSYSDISVTHYPNAVFLLRSLQEWKTIPFWSPSLFSGYPFIANPLSGVWYLPGWLALIFPLPLGFNILIAVHLVWMGLGMYQLLKAEGLSYYPSLLAALATSCMPKIFAHIGAGHVSLIYAMSWTPWLLLAGRRGLRAEPGRIADPDLSGLVLGVLILADVRWAVYAGLLWVAYRLCILDRVSLFRMALNRLFHLLSQAGLAALIASPLLLPLLEYTRLTTRSTLTAQEGATLALPAGRLLGLIFPDFAGYYEWMVYSGAGIFILALLSLLVNKRSRVLFWLGSSVVALGFALGSDLPFNNLLHAIPGYDLLRVPSRWLFVSGIGIAAASGYGLEWLMEKSKPASDLRKAKRVLFALASLGLFLTMGIWIASGKLPLNFAWGSVLLIIISTWLGFSLNSESQSSSWLLGLVLICLLDLWLIDRTLVNARPVESVLAEGAKAAQFITSKPGRFRVYSPSYSLPQQTAAYYGLEMASGVDPLQLRSYVEYMQRASGVPSGGYSVALPGLGDDPLQSNREFIPDAELLGVLNVAFVVAEYDLNAPYLALENTIGETRIYRNTLAKPRAWIQLDGRPEGVDDLEAELVSWLPNRIILNAAGPGLLVLSEVAYPGWQVWVDGKEQELEIAHNILRAVRLEPGDHHITFLFRPMSVFLGLLLFASAAAIMIGTVYVRRK